MLPKILTISDSKENLVLIESLLEDFPCIIDFTSNGIQALQKILSRRYSVIIAFPPLPLLDISRLVEIIRTNPNTSSISLFVIYQSENDYKKYAVNSEEHAVKPIDKKKFLNKLNNLLPESRIKKLLDKSRSASFSLKELSAMDFLQLLYQNRRTGIVEIVGENKKGKIYLDKGNIVAARMGTLKGEKALNRLIGIESGTAVFNSSSVDIEQEFTYPTPHLILMAIQEKDETEELLKQLSTKEFSLSKNFKDKILNEDHVVEEIINILEYTTYLDVIIDSVNIPDSKILKILLSLTNSGIVVPPNKEIKQNNVIITPSEERKIIEIISQKKDYFSGDYSDIILLYPEYPEQLKKIVKFLYRDNGNFDATESFSYLGFYNVSKNLKFNFYSVEDIDVLSPFLRSLSNAIFSMIFIFDEFSQESLYIVERKGYNLVKEGIDIIPMYLEKVQGGGYLSYQKDTKENFNRIMKSIIKYKIIKEKKDGRND